MNLFSIEANLLVTLLDLFFAGTESTVSALVWALLVLAMNPEKQEKLAEEITVAVHGDRVLSLHHREK